MKNNNFKIKNIIILSIFFLIPLLGCTGYSFEEVQSVTITKEDILNAKPSKSPVNFSDKDLKYIETMEKRHFERTYPELSDYERLKNLEYELLGKPWLYTDKSIRIDKLKIASSNRMLTGAALPVRMSSRRTVKRLRNDVVQIRDTDSVGLIDGFFRLLAPEAYKQYREFADKEYFKFDEY